MSADSRSTFRLTGKAALFLLLILGLMSAHTQSSFATVNSAAAWGEGWYQRGSRGFEFHFNHNPIDFAGGIDTVSWYDPFGGSPNDRFSITRLRHLNNPRPIERYQSWGRILCTVVGYNTALVGGIVEQTNDRYLRPTNVNSEGFGTPTRRQFIQIYVLGRKPNKVGVSQRKSLRSCGKRTRGTGRSALREGYVQIERDNDSDGHVDRLDNCPVDTNKGQEDREPDGVGDVCDRSSSGTGKRDFIHGNRYDEVIRGLSAGDSLAGSEGNDEIHGGKGNDGVYGQSGNDRLYGGMGSDVLLGGNGNDVLNGGRGSNLIDGGPGRDRINSVNDRVDFVDGGDGKDRARVDPFDHVVRVEKVTLDLRFAKDTARDAGAGKRKFRYRKGTSGRDRLRGSDFSDWLVGRRGADTLFGLGGNDKLVGNTGRDRLFGGNGDDTLSGSSANDKLSGGRGSDKLLGGTGNDRALFPDRLHFYRCCPSRTAGQGENAAVFRRCQSSAGVGTVNAVH